MPKDTVVVRCPSCKAKIKIPSARSEMSCPKCRQAINVAKEMVRSSSPKQKRPSSPPSRLQEKQNHSTTVEGSVPALGFYSYFTKHWQQSHGHWLLPIFFTSLLAVPILSFIKPAIGFHGQLYAVAGLLGLSITSFLVYSVQRLLGYYFGGDRAIPEDTTSKLAAFAYSGVILAIFPLGPLVAVEYVMPEKGLLANFVPPVAEQQSKLLAKLNLAGTKETVALTTASSNGGEDELSDDDSTSEPVTTATRSTDVSQASSATDTEKRNASDRSSGATTHSKDDTSPKSLGGTTDPTASVTTTSNPKEMVVIAEGVGTTSDDALKDAFRNAVRQVVGAVIDADTLIKNDEIISDKVLTYSDGFIPKYDVLKESKREGLFRMKIKATVERRSLIARLKAANVTLKAVDGKGLFAAAVTQAEAKDNATALLKKALKDLPTFLTAKVVNKSPQEMYDSSKSEIVIDLELSADRKAYAAFAERLEQVLKKISVDQTSVLVNAISVRKNSRPVEGFFENKNIPQLLGPKLDGKRRASCVWVCAFNNKTNTTTRWNGYVVEVDLGKAAARLQQARMLGFRSPKRFGPSSKTLVTTSALDSGGKLVVEDEFELVSDGGLAYSLARDMRRYNAYRSGGYIEVSFLRKLVIRKLDGGYDEYDTKNAWAVLAQIENQSPRAQNDAYYARIAANLYIAPYSFTVTNGLSYRLTTRVTRRLKVSLDELKRIQDIRCKVSFRP